MRYEKNKVIISLVVGLIIVGLLIGIIHIRKIINIILSETQREITNIEAYKGRSSFFDVEYYEDYWSHLLIFPENDKNSMEIVRYYYKSDTLNLDSEYKIILEYTLKEQEYQEEKDRISGISMSYKDVTQKNLNPYRVHSPMLAS